MPAGTLVKQHDGARLPPYGKRKKKTYKKKYARRTTGKLMSEYVSPNPMPPMKRVAFTYAEDFTLTSQAVTGLSGAEAVYRLNTPYQPQHTAGGTSHQSYGWDQMVAFYRKYKVYAIKWDVEFSNPSADGMYGVVMLQGSEATGTTGPGLSDAQLREQPMTAIKYVNNTGSQKISFRGYSPLYKIEGVTNLQYKSQIGDEYASITTANPQHTPYIRVNCGDTTLTGGLTVHCTVKLTMYTEMYDRKVLGQS